MAGTANISSSFAITYIPSNASQTVITNPGRTFRVVGVQVNNPTGGGLACEVLDGADNQITLGGNFTAGANTSSWSDLNTANVEIAANENLKVTAAAGITSVEILCVAASGGQPLFTVA